MSDDTPTESTTEDDHPEHAPRETAPMSDFTTRDVGIGVVVLVVGLLITVAIPLVFG